MTHFVRLLHKYKKPLMDRNNILATYDMIPQAMSPTAGELPVCCQVWRRFEVELCTLFTCLRRDHAAQSTQAGLCVVLTDDIPPDKGNTAWRILQAFEHIRTAA